MRFGSPFVPSLPAALVTVSVVPGGDVALPAATDTLILTTPSLAVGTWLVSASAEFVLTGVVASDCELYLGVGTAAVAFSGPIASDTELPALASGAAALAFTCLAIVSVAGTLTLRGVSVLAATAKQTATAGTVRAVTGLVAVKIG